MHRDDCRDVALHERTGHAREGVCPRGPGALACVEDRQTQRREIVQHHAQLVAAHGSRPAVVVLEQKHAALAVAVIAPVTDVVQRVERLGLKGLEQSTEGGPLAANEAPPLRCR